MAPFNSARLIVKLFVDNLTHVDFSYLDAQRGLLGESWVVNLVLEGGLDAQGMICDFGTVKKRVKQWLDSHVDHCLVVAQQMAAVDIRQHDGVTELYWRYPQGEVFYCRSPQQAIVPVALAEITPLGLAHWCEQQLLALFPEQVERVRLEFVPESIDGAYYHYSHGLQQHAGNCQRIAHGHRSRLQVLRNGARDSALEQAWAERWRDIYIGTDAHLISTENGQHHYQYQAPQGAFELRLPARCCYLIDTESTVEQIAVHLAQQIKLGAPADNIEVRAFEGIGKGAIAVA